MGLDMYLSKKTYVSQDERKVLKNLPVNIDKNKLTYLVIEVAYWRKANHIHKWFVDNIQDGVDDCGEYHVANEQLNELVDLCKEVIDDHSKAENLLPTESGFFFGGTEYDEYYFQNLQDTIEMLEDSLSDVDSYFYYQASW